MVLAITSMNPHLSIHSSQRASPGRLADPDFETKVTLDVREESTLRTCFNQLFCADCCAARVHFSNAFDGTAKSGL